MHRLGLLALLASGPTVAEAAAPPGRAESWRQKRLEKLQSLRAPKRSPGERILLMLEEGSPTGLNFKGFYPEVSQLGTGSGFAPRVRYWRARVQGSPLDLQASAQVSIRNYHLYDLQLGRIQHQGRRLSMPQKNYERIDFTGRGPRVATRWLAYGELRYRYFPQEDFFGMGTDSFFEDRTTYTLRDRSLDAVAGGQVRWFAAGVRAGLLQAAIAEGTDRRFPSTAAVFGDDLAPGLDSQPGFFRVEASVQLDFRDRPGNPHRGAFLGLHWARFDDRGGRDFQFSRRALDARGFLPLGSPQRVLALRFFISHDRPDRGSRVPFYLLETVGGSHSLRGFFKSRFADRSLVALSAEYRWEALPFVELAVFADAGRSLDDPFEIGFSRLRRSTGVGVRFKSHESVLFRTDVAWSREGTRLYLKFSPSF
jgi:hypothetical protein